MSALQQLVYRNAAGLCDQHSSILAWLFADLVDSDELDDAARMTSMRAHLAELQSECAKECGA